MLFTSAQAAKDFWDDNDLDLEYGHSARVGRRGEHFVLVVTENGESIVLEDET